VGKQFAFILEKSNLPVSKYSQGGHRNFKHLKGCKITVSGKIGDDAKPYQIKAVKKAIGEVS